MEVCDPPPFEGRAPTRLAVYLGSTPISSVKFKSELIPLDFKVKIFQVRTGDDEDSITTYEKRIVYSLSKKR